MFNNCILKELSKNPHVLNKDIFIGLNQNSWTTIEIINTWINKVVLPYAKKFDGNRQFLLVWDRAKTYLNEETNKLFQNNNINIVLIPAGMTRILQPLDVATIQRFIKRN